MMLISRKIFIETQKPGALVYGNSFYTRADGIEKIRTIAYEYRDDTVDAFDVSFSDDNGLSWSATQKKEVKRTTADGTYRRIYTPSFVDPTHDKLLTFATEGFLPSDDPMEGMKSYYLCYQISSDGGRTSSIDEQMIQNGPQYDRHHPFENVWIGKNSIFLGDVSCRPISLPGGRILLPAQLTPIGPDGQYYNPGGGYSYHEAIILIGDWQPDGTIKWNCSRPIKNDPMLSTRGAIEPTLCQLSGSSILMIVRGSNDVKLELPSYKWYSLSTDQGLTWSPLKPWTYTTGENFFSPSSCSQLLKHSNGRSFWIGNLIGHNAKGNSPRYPLVIAELDGDSALLLKDSVLVLDDCQAGESEELTVSGLMAYEDRLSGNIIVHATRAFADGISNWTGYPFVYNVSVRN